MEESKKSPEEQELKIVTAEECGHTEDQIMKMALLKTFEKNYGPLKIRSGPPKEL